MTPSLESDSSSSSGLRLLVVSNMWPTETSPVFGSFVARNVRGLREAGARVTVVANTDSRRGALRALVKYASLSRRARRAARQGTFDVVIGHYLYPTAAFAYAAARRARVPLVLVSHGTDSRSVMRGDRFARRARQALRSASLVVAVSRSLREILRDDVGVPAEIPIEVVNMGFDDSVFKPDPAARERLRLSAQDRIVLFVGNLEPVKGVDVLMDAAVTLLDAGAVDRIVLVGAGSLEASIRTRLELLAVDESHADPTGRVHLAGPLEQRDLALWMSAADVLVLPSRNEGLGLVLLEAMACGTPCVASDVGGIPEILDETCGRLVGVGDADAVADAISEVLALGTDTFRDSCIARAAAHSSSSKAAELLAHIERVVD